MKDMRGDYVIFILTLILGAMIWLASPYITGLREPWDAESGYYYISLIAIGFVAGIIAPSRFWLWAVGIWLGQLLVFVFQLLMFRSGPLWPLGMVFLFVLSFLSLIGSAVGAGCRSALRAVFTVKANRNP